MLGTIVAGVLVFIVCEWFKEIWLSPLQEFKKLKGKTSHLLVDYARYYCNPLTITNKNQDYDTASQQTRNLAAEWSAFAEIIPFFPLGLPTVEKTKQICTLLIGLSNGYYMVNLDAMEKRIDRSDAIRMELKKLLKLKGIPDKDKPVVGVKM